MPPSVTLEPAPPEAIDEATSPVASTSALRAFPDTIPTRPRRRRRRLPIGLNGLMALGVFAAYVRIAHWVFYDLGYSIGDALARTANAKYILFSRDPHLAALGFDWMPLPTLLQLPLMAVLEPLGMPEFAGPLSTSMLMAGTVWVLGRLCRRLGLGRTWSLVFPLAFALNPVVVLYAANGMSEACLFFFLAVSLLGFLQFTDKREHRHLVVLAFGLAGATLSRYEAAPAVLAIGVGAAFVDFRFSRWRRAASTLAIAILPAIWAAAIWFFAQWQIKGDALSFRKGGGETSRADVTAIPYLPTPGDTVGAFEFVAGWTIDYGPLLVLLVPLLLIPPLRKSIAGITVLGAAAAIPSVTWYLITKGGTFANPRYFVTAVIFSGVAACWLATRRPPALLRPMWRGLLLCGLLLSAERGTFALLDPTRTPVEQEYRALGPMLGRADASPALFSDTGSEWTLVAEAVDDIIRPGEVVLADARYNFPAIVYSRKSEQFIINSDRDYLQTVAEPDGEFDYVLTPPENARGGLVGEFDTGGRIVRGSPPGTWEAVATFQVATLYRLIDEDADLPPGA